MIHVENLNKKYPGAEAAALRSLSFEVPAGGLAAILGRSGAGKSTLLRCLIGLEAFDGGVVKVGAVAMRGLNGGRVTREHRACVSGIRAQMGFVFQSFELFPHLTVLENCALAPVCVRREKESVVHARVRTLLAQLGLEDKANAFPEHLSGGQRQRVAIARALAMEPRVLLYDEPTSALDPSLKHEVFQTIQRVQQTGVTQVVVTHDLQLARAMGTVFVIDRGEIVESGVPAEVLAAPRHEATQRLLATA